MQFRMAIPDGVLTEDIINAGLEMTTRANEELARRGLLPDLGYAIRNGLRWRPEPWVGEEFALAPVASERGWADCDDLAPWLAAQLRAVGEDARAFVYRSTPRTYHAVVERIRTGEILDPSKWAGMPSRTKAFPLSSGVAPLVGDGRSIISLLPHAVQRRWFARADMPVAPGAHMVSWSANPDVQLAMHRALAGYGLLGSSMAGPSVGGLWGDIAAYGAAAAAIATGNPELAPAAAAAGRKLGDYAEEKYNEGSEDAPAPPPGGEEHVATQNTVNTGPPRPYTREEALAGKAGPAAQAAAEAAEAAAKPQGKPAGKAASSPAFDWSKVPLSSTPSAAPVSYDIPGPGGRGSGRVIYHPNGAVLVEF